MKHISILIFVDAVGVLVSESLDNNLYLLDDNKNNGSENLGTGVLKTAVKKGDEIMWTVMALEPESFSSLINIEIKPEYCVPTKQTYPGTNVVFWKGEVLKDIKENTAIPYSMQFSIGNPSAKFKTSSKRPSLTKSKK